MFLVYKNCIGDQTLFFEHFKIESQTSCKQDRKMFYFQYLEKPLVDKHQRFCR